MFANSLFRLNFLDIPFHSPTGIGILSSSRLVPAISSFPIFVHNNDVYSFRCPAIFLAIFLPVSPSLSWIILRSLTFRSLRVSFFASQLTVSTSALRVNCFSLIFSSDLQIDPVLSDPV